MEKLVQRVFFLGLLTSWMIIGCAKRTDLDPSKVAALQAAASATRSSLTIRENGLKQTARSLGAQAGLAWRSYNLNVMLERQKRNLDHVFNFNYLMLSHNVLPPVLAEGREVLNLTDDFTIRLSGHDYQIIQAPRFVTTPPNWRSYIWMIYQKPEHPNATLLPKTRSERQIWNEHVQIGWSEGLEQADQIFTTNLARLQRDCQGMILYRKLLAQNMVTPPYVAQADLGVTGDSNNLHIDDRVLRITEVSHLRVNSQDWRPAIALPANGQGQVGGESERRGENTR